jgi:hypothetical protein
MKNKRTKKIFRNCSLYMLYVILIISILCSIGRVNVVTTYNISGVSSLQSSHLLDKYVPPEPEPEPEPEVVKASSEPIRQYRLTSFYANDGYGTGECVGAGFCSWDFGVNEFGWYTYDGKLVLAAATTYLQNKFGTRDGITYFKYYDEVNVTIDGVVYPGIILDTCGACYRDVRLDLFVQDGPHGIDRGYMGRNMITVEITKKK